MTSTYKWFGSTGFSSDPADWVLESGPGNASGVPENGDTIIIAAGDVATTENSELSQNLIELSGATIEFTGADDGQAQFDSSVQLTTAVAGVTAPADSTLDAFGQFVNNGVIDADGPAGSTLTIDVATFNGGSFPVAGRFTNSGTIEADAGNTVTIAIDPGNLLLDNGSIVAAGSHIVIQGGPISAGGGIAGDTSFFLIGQGGSVETNLSPITGEHSPIYEFTDASSGNTLKIDDIANFGGRILGFGVNDTIDLGANLSVATVVYDATTGILELEDSGNNVLASLDFISGALHSGTFGVDPVTGQAGSFKIGTGADGNTVLTTSAVNATYLNNDGTWQDATNWSGGAVPGANDSVFLGLNASGGFTLNTGASPVTVAGLYLVQDGALDVSSNLTITTYGIDAFGGSIEDEGGQTLTTAELYQTSGAITVDQGGTLVLTGHPEVSPTASGGQLSLTGTSIGADILGGTLHVAGDLEATSSLVLIQGVDLSDGAQVVVEAGGTINAQTLELDDFSDLILQGGTVNAQAIIVYGASPLEGYGKVTGLSENFGEIVAGDGTEGKTLEIDHGLGVLGFTSGSTLQVDNSIDPAANVQFSSDGPQTLLIESAALLADNAFIINDMQIGDRLEFGPGVTATNAVLSGNTLTVDITGPNAPSGSSTLTFDQVDNAQSSFFTTGIDAATGNSFVEMESPCYCPGTLMRAASGEKPVEELSIGDKVMTAAGVLRPIKWIGRRSYGGRFILGRTDVLPICIKTGALAPEVPLRDLWISPHHAMFLDGLLIEAKDLVNGVSIVQAEQVDKVEYVHIELDTHDVIIAEGALSESFLDDDSRMMFQNAAEYFALYPDATREPARYCAPRRDGGFEVDAVRRRIATRAGLRVRDDAAQLAGLRGYVDHVSEERIAGWAQTVDHPEAPVCLDIYAGGRRIGQVLANGYRADLAQAGVGSGRHGFDFAVPPALAASPSAIEVRRAFDGAALEFSPQVRKTLPEDARGPHQAAHERLSSKAASVKISVYRRSVHAG